MKRIIVKLESILIRLTYFNHQRIQCINTPFLTWKFQVGTPYLLLELEKHFQDILKNVL